MSAAHVVLPGRGRALVWRGSPVNYLATGGDVADAYTLSRGTVAPASGAPPHSHTFAEAFYVLRGEMTFRAGRDTITLPAGGFIHIPPDLAHSTHNHTTADAEVLVLTRPVGFDAFQFETAASPDDMARIGEKYGIDLHPTPEALAAEPTGVIVRRPGEGRIIDVVGDRYRFLVEGEECGDAYAVWEATVPPGGGPPPHIHRREAEGFLVLAGGIRFTVGNETMDAVAGTFANMPVGLAHAFKNVGDVPARMLILVAPAGLERMFRRTGVAVAGASTPIAPVRHDEIERLVGVAPEFGIELLHP